MSKHSSKAMIEYSLPPGCELLHFPRTDGDSVHWPPNQEEVEDEDGSVNFYKPIPEQQGMSLKWLHGVGQKVAEMMDMPKGKQYAFASWPDGYRFFDHHKGAKASPRHDNYVIGCTTVSRFRSIPEIVPHALWLMTDPTMDRSNCNCKYCSKRQQSAVSQQYGFPSQAFRGSAAPTASQSSKRRNRNHQPYAAVQRTKALKAQTENVQTAKKRKRETVQESQRTAQLEPPKETVPNERISDLISAAMRLGPERRTRRFHRQGELVWCMLAVPIRAALPGDNATSITMWPAIIREWGTIQEFVAREDYEQPPSGMIDAEELARIEAGRPRVAAGHHYAGEGQVGNQYRSFHRTRYSAQLLAIDAQIRVLDDCVLPYPAWAPPASLLSILSEIPTDRLDYKREYCPPATMLEQPSQQDIETAFVHAAAPYSVALEAAAELAALWSVTDEWNAETLNADNQEEPETRYQGLWWGPERIWVGDLVQLKMPRKQLQGPMLRDPFKVEDREEEVGAGDRGVFMHLKSLKPVEMRTLDGQVHTEICASGELFEVAEDPACLSTQIPQEEGDEVQRKMTDAAKRAHERQVDEAARGVEGLDVNASGNGSAKGKEREDVAMRPTSDVAPAPPTDVTFPNPDPTVPIDQTVPAMLDALGAPSANTNGVPPRTDIGGLSGPANVEEQLPPAPPPFAFRPLLLEAGHEASVSLDLLGGRYYPGILQHPLLFNIRQMIIDAAIHRPDEMPPAESEAVLALEGISPGYNCAMSPTRMIVGRKKAIERAEARAVELLKGSWARKANGMNGVQEVNGGGDGMQREGTWTATPPTDDAMREGLASMFGNGDGMDVDLDAFL
ncbi:hypothetical protein PENSPDRAFT_754249 [Peniophora sp. CONT]|nr:hypothetical protein PENSPDRAFT_754249 [Peniophora sp. CONT]